MKNILNIVTLGNFPYPEYIKFHTCHIIDWKTLWRQIIEVPKNHIVLYMTCQGIKCETKYSRNLANNFLIDIK